MSALPYPVFAFEPDFTREPRYRLASMQDTLALGHTREVVLFPQESVDRLFGFDLQLTGGGPLALMEFFRNRGGKAKPFFAPSWRRDLQHIGDIIFGQTQLEVEFLDYHNAHLNGTRQDHYGRWLWAWTPGQPLFLDRVIRATANGTTSDILDLDSPIPWAAANTAVMCGFAHVCRFADGELRLASISADVATAEVVLRSYRETVSV